jgi:hypothetical protein
MGKLADSGQRAVRPEGRLGLTAMRRAALPIIHAQPWGQGRGGGGAQSTRDRRKEGTTRQRSG